MEPLHKGRRARRTPHSRPLTFTSQQKRSRGRGRDKTACWTVGDRGSTDELGGVGKRAGGGGWLVGLSDPIQHAQKKSRPKPLRRTRVAMATPLPSGTRSAGNQLTESVCGVNGGATSVMSSLLEQTGLAVTSSRAFLSSVWAKHERHTFASDDYLRSQVFPRVPVHVHVLRVWKRVYRGCCSVGPTRLHLHIVLLPE